tara:strand:- start:381 stop:1148 length:768 start_codon:yes stop_codon:yes gene_type:complete
MERNKNYNENCLETMSRMEDNFIDLTVTSPPYDNLRTYKGFDFDFESVAKELYRTTKDGGVVVWIVGDATVKGSESGTSFKQALFFKECGFNLHDTMIYRKTKIIPMDYKCNRYYQGFEYMFVFSKGKPKTCNYIKIKSKHAGKKAISINRMSNGDMRKDRVEKQKNRVVSEMKTKDNVWSYGSKSIKGHPATFPEQLANDHIISWSNENDIVYDPFMGSGTTAKRAILNNRNWLGSEMSSEYCDIINERVKDLI